MSQRQMSLCLHGQWLSNIFSTAVECDSILERSSRDYEKNNVAGPTAQSQILAMWQDLRHYAPHLFEDEK